MDDERVLWTLPAGDAVLECVLVSCCTGAELQIRRRVGSDEASIVIRELYPLKSDLYARARMLRANYATP